MKNFLLPVLLLLFINATAQQKKPLDHTVYDGWKSIGEKLISHDGQFVVYTINPQEGDGELVIQNPATKFKKTIARGYNAVITEDSRYLVFKIKPLFQDTRQAKIKKKKADEMSKDTLAIIELGKEDILKIPRVKNYKTPEKGFGWIAYQLEKPLPDTAKKTKPVYDSAKAKTDRLVKLADSVIRHSIDSIKGKISDESLVQAAQKAANAIIKSADLDGLTGNGVDAEGDETAGGAAADGTDLVLRNTADTLQRFLNRSPNIILINKDHAY